MSPPKPPKKPTGSATTPATPDPSAKPGKTGVPSSIETPDQLAGLVEVLGLLLGRLQGMEGANLRDNVGKLKDSVQTLVTVAEQNAQTDAARAEAAVEVEKLVDTVVQTGTTVGRQLETQRGPIVDAFRAADLDKAAEGLHLLAEWMAHPTDEGRARVEDLVAELQKRMGTVIGYDPDREDAERREEIRLGVKESLDKIFKPKPKA